MRTMVPLRTAASKAIPVAMVLMALAILVGDLRTDVVVNVGVLYIAVVLMSARIYMARGVIVVTLGCAVLTLVGYLLSPGDQWSVAAIANRFLGLAAMGSVTFLALRDKSAQQALRQAQTELAHASRLTAMGQLTASIGHEVRQPITSSIINARAALRWLDRPTPDLEEAKEALAHIVDDANRASEVLNRIRDLARKALPRQELLDINGTVRELIELTSSEAIKNGISVKIELVEGLPPVLGDRVQLQQVILNLVVNAVEAMSETSESFRELRVSTAQTPSGDVLVEVRDSGPGVRPDGFDQLFEAFHTTKPSGLGLGLSICRSIVEAHGGQLWASANEPRGAIFHFTVPTQSGGATP